MNAGLTELIANTCFCMLPNSNAACARSSRADDKLALADFYTNSECACELDFFFFFLQALDFFSERMAACTLLRCNGCITPILRSFSEFD